VNKIQVVFRCKHLQVVFRCKHHLVPHIAEALGVERDDEEPWHELSDNPHLHDYFVSCEYEERWYEVGGHYVTDLHDYLVPDSALPTFYKTLKKIANYLHLLGMEVEWWTAEQEEV